MPQCTLVSVCGLLQGALVALKARYSAPGQSLTMDADAFFNRRELLAPSVTKDLIVVAGDAGAGAGAAGAAAPGSIWCGMLQKVRTVVRAADRISHRAH